MRGVGALGTLHELRQAVEDYTLDSLPLRVEPDADGSGAGVARLAQTSTSSATPVGRRTRHAAAVSLAEVVAHSSTGLTRLWDADVVRYAAIVLTILVVLTAALLANSLLDIDWAAYVALGVLFLLALLRLFRFLPGFGDAG